MAEPRGVGSDVPHGISEGEVVILEFIRHYGKYNPGDVARLRPSIAEQILNQRITGEDRESVPVARVFGDRVKKPITDSPVKK